MGCGVGIGSWLAGSVDGEYSGELITKPAVNSRLYLNVGN